MSTTASVISAMRFRICAAVEVARHRDRGDPEPQVGALLPRLPAAVHGILRRVPDLDADRRLGDDRECDVQRDGCDPDRDIACRRDQTTHFGTLRPRASEAWWERAHCTRGEPGPGAEPVKQSLLCPIESYGLNGPELF
jgi:hypothetical protein